MAKERGRPKGSGNRKHRDQDHKDCIAIAQLRLARARTNDLGCDLSRNRRLRQVATPRYSERRLYRRYVSHESRYIYLARLAARPTQSHTVDDLVTSLNLSAVLCSISKEQEERTRILRDFTAPWEKLQQAAA